MSEDAIQYQGRKARRSGSEQRRKAILEAALKIIVRDGVRNVRHRAVAREAAVPLSATTYYFKDITDLISDTFTLFAERAMKEVIEPFSAQVFALLEQFDADILKDEQQRNQLLDTLSEITAAYIMSEVTQKRDHLVAEQAFMQEALINDRLRMLAETYNSQQVAFLRKACEKLRTPAPVIDAEFMMANFLRFEYRLMIDSAAMTQTELQAGVRHMLQLLVGKL